MCDMTTRSRLPRTIPRPRWGPLYGIVVVMLVALAAAELVPSPGPIQTALQCGLALGGFAAMVLWTRLNRGALDQQDWCECAAGKVTMRVIPSRRPEPERADEDEELLETVAS